MAKRFHALSLLQEKEDLAVGLASNAEFRHWYV